MCPWRIDALGAILCSVLALAAASAATGSVANEEFRVENQVFFGGGKKAGSRSTTIFCGGRVFDYMEEPPEVVVFDKPEGRFVLLDTARRVRAELSTDEVLAFTRRLQQEAAAHPRPSIRFLAAPRFDEQFDKASGELTLSSPWMTYRLLLVDAGGAAISRQYRESCDWYARVNTLLKRGSKPPLARLAVNAALAEREAIAREVHLTLTSEEGPPTKRVTIRSTHRLIPKLSEADRDRVTQTRQFMQIFKPVSFQEYRRAGRP